VAPARWRRPRLIPAWLAGGGLYVLVVGSFSRYSWPATVAVVALGVAVVVTGWRGPRHPRSTKAKLPAAGLALWGLVLLAGVILQLLATRTRARVPSLGTVLAWAMNTRTRRVGMLVAWAWVGLHFFAR
jgi:hypothetical protein